MPQIRIGRLALVLVALVSLTVAVLMHGLHQIREAHRPVGERADGSVQLEGSVADARGRLLAVGGTVHGQTDESSIFRRTNNGHWSSAGSPEPRAELRGVAAGGGTMAVVGHGHEGSTVWTQTGNALWRVAFRDDLIAYFVGIAGHTGTFAALGTTADGTPVAVLGEGSDWTKSALPLPEGSTGGTVFSVVASPTEFIVAGAVETAKGSRPVIWRSTTPMAWTLVPLPFDEEPGPRRTSGFATAAAVGDTSMAIVGQVDGRPVSWLENSGLWSTTPLPGSSPGSMVVGLAANPSGGFVAAGTVTGLGDSQHGIAWASRDGRQWRTAVIPQATTGLRAVVVTNGGVVLIGGHLDGRKETPLVVAAPAPPSN